MDTIANFLTTLRNAEYAGHGTVAVATSKMKKAIAAVLKETGMTGPFREEGDILHVELIAGARHEYRRISKPGRRLYVGAREIPTVRNGRGVVIVSTPLGVMSGKAAKKKGVGGEIIAQVF